MCFPGSGFVPEPFTVWGKSRHPEEALSHRQSTPTGACPGNLGGDCSEVEAAAASCGSRAGLPGRCRLHSITLLSLLLRWESEPHMRFAEIRHVCLLADHAIEDSGSEAVEGVYSQEGAWSCSCVSREEECQEEETPSGG